MTLACYSLFGGGAVSFRQYARQNLVELVHVRCDTTMRAAFFQTCRFSDSLGDRLLLSRCRRVP